MFDRTYQWFFVCLCKESNFEHEANSKIYFKK